MSTSGIAFDLEPTLFVSHSEEDAAYSDAIGMIEGHESFLVVAHEGPDGDAIGSTLAMCELLWQLGKTAVPFNVDPVGYNFGFLPGADRWRTTLEPEATFDVTVVVDCCGLNRLGSAFPANGIGQHVLVIDHHSTYDAEFPDVLVRDLGAAAVGEMIFRLGAMLGTRLTHELALCCYTSLVTDTGSFRYSNTSPTSFGIASHLVAAGVDPWYITSHVYENNPVERLTLLAKVLSTLTLSACGRLAFLTVDNSWLEDSTYGTDLIDGFINYARGVRGVEVATQLHQQPDGRYKVSFRSRGLVNVGALAETLGGGGHHNAAGCVVTGTVASIRAQLAANLDSLLEA